MPMHTAVLTDTSAKLAVISPIMDKMHIELLLRENDQLLSGIPGGAGGMRLEGQRPNTPRRQLPASQR